MKKKKNPVLPDLWRIGSIIRVSHCSHSLNLLITGDPEKQPLIHVIVRVGFPLPNPESKYAANCVRKRRGFEIARIWLSQDSVTLFGLTSA
ncbi:MAG: hypothetical protein HQL96_12300 [Magnetococcales bacterium]|nr:hypothetical protein [Magnetococcales bacterium]